MPSLLIPLWARGPFLSGFIGDSLAHACRSQDILGLWVSGPWPVAGPCLSRKGSDGLQVTGKSNARFAHCASQSALPCSSKGSGPQQAVLDFPSPALPGQRVCSRSTLTFCPIPLQGIERLQRSKQPRELSGSWKSVQEAFGGEFSLNWFNPFTRPCQPEIPIDKGLVRQVSSLSDMDNVETAEGQLEETKDRDPVEVLGE